MLQLLGAHFWQHNPSFSWKTLREVDVQPLLYHVEVAPDAAASTAEYSFLEVVLVIHLITELYSSKVTPTDIFMLVDVCFWCRN